MVNGQPVCDDGPAYRAATAAVVCRFKFLPIILFPCLFMKFLDCLFFASKSDICSLGSLDTMEQVNTQHNRTSGKSRTNLEWTMCSARAMKLPSLTALIKPRTIVVEVKDWGSSVQQVNAINDQGSHILQIIQDMSIIISLIISGAGWGFRPSRRKHHGQRRACLR